MWQIKLIYFKYSGKYYSEGSFWTDLNYMYEIVNEVSQMREDQKLPDISCGKEFFIMIDASAHPNGFPVLIKPID